ncbi:MAG: molybdopterin-synthase adenylyltransferase MoeB [Verrucomicrobiae bacterium]|nr:molybdopterin-synthase adenylyltransferase MoeB [Verrucomicrobiae bacterium]
MRRVELTRPAMKLTNEEIRRYSRHLILPEVGIAGQEKLKAARVLLIGSGGLGSPLGLYLAAAGVGTLGMVDFDQVDFSNLQRQIIHFTGDVGRPKLSSAADKIHQLNPEVRLIPYETRFTAENAMEIAQDYDIVIDGTDNFPTRYLVNDVCVLLKKPNVYGSIFRFEGQVSVFDATKGPCYRCLYPEPPPPGSVPSCAEGGVLGMICGVIGTLQAVECVKLILGRGEPLVGRLLLYDSLRGEFRKVKLRKDPQCPVCGERPSITQPIDYEQFCGFDPHDELITGATQKMTDKEISPEELKKILAGKEPVELIDVRTEDEFRICKLPGARLIPLHELKGRLDEIDERKLVVLQCHHGIRSIRAVEVLEENGFEKVKSLAGGINAWSERIDPSVPRY